RPDHLRDARDCHGAPSFSSSLGSLEQEDDLHLHAVLRDLAAFDLDALADHLEPRDVAEGSRGAGEALLDRLPEPVGRGGNNLRHPRDCHEVRVARARTWRKPACRLEATAGVVRLDLLLMPVLLLARRQLGSHGARAALTAAGIACGVALVVAIEVINASPLGAFTEAIEDLAGTASLQVRGGGDFPEDVAERLRDLPGIEHAVPILTDTFFVVGGPAADEALSVF